MAIPTGTKIMGVIPGTDRDTHVRVEPADLAGASSGGGLTSIAVPTPGAYLSARGTNNNGTAIPVNRLFATPVELGGAGSINGIAYQITTAAGAGGVMRVGLYADDPASGRPGALLVGDVTDPTTSTGVKTVAIPAQAVTAGRYWIAVVAQVAGCGVILNTWHAGLLGGADVVTGINTYFADSVSGALPASFPTPGPTFAGNGPRTAVRFA